MCFTENAKCVVSEYGYSVAAGVATLSSKTPVVNEELFDTYLGYVTAEGPNPNDELKYNYYETYKSQDSLWGQTMVLLEIQTKKLKESYEKYQTALEKAVKNNRIIKL